MEKAPDIFRHGNYPVRDTFPESILMSLKMTMREIKIHPNDGLATKTALTINIFVESELYLLLLELPFLCVHLKGKL